MYDIQVLTNETISALTKEELLSDETFDLLLSEEDPVVEVRKANALAEQAKRLGCIKEFNALRAAFRRVKQDAIRMRRSGYRETNNVTNYIYPANKNYPVLCCGAWVADENGVSIDTPVGFAGMQHTIACSHPILLLERVKNIATKEEMVRLAYKRNNLWQETDLIEKSVIANASKITALSNIGIAVNSENAKALVRFLSELDVKNEDLIDLKLSTSKFGWINDENYFIPYDDLITFDGDMRFKQLSESLTERGNMNIWMEHIKKLRKTGRIEIKAMMAASFASVLVEIVGALPFFVDLWGMTEGGKTVTLMVAASIWANPGENAYIGDFKSTDVGLEAKANVLNSLPLILDDTSRVSKKLQENLEGVIYDLCSGKGKTRSNRLIGVQREGRWRNTFLSTGENPLTGYADQGGALNRVLEIECGEKVFENPHETAETVKRNYGFAGREFIDIIKGMGFERVQATFSQVQDELRKITTDKMQKQIMSLATLLTADRIATDKLFMDDEYIPLVEAIKWLLDREEVSDNQRCYEYIMSKVDQNPNRFDSACNTEQWGIIEDGYVYFYTAAIGDLCKEYRRSLQSFIKWADHQNILVKGNDNKNALVKKINGKAVRCYCIRLEGTENDFSELDSGQEMLIFQ